MKKIIAVLVALLCICSISVSADDTIVEHTQTSINLDYQPKVEFNDDFSKLYYAGDTFIRFNEEMIVSSVSFSSESAFVRLTGEQRKTVSSMNIELDYDNSVIFASYNLKDGGSMDFTYLKEDYIQIYNDIMQNKWEDAKINFMWPEGNVVIADKEELKAKSVNLFTSECSDEFDVFAPIDGKDFGIMVGRLCSKNGKYYYIDFNDNDIVYGEDFDLNDYSNLLAYEITDSNLIAQINSAYDKYYGSDLGFLEDDKFTSVVSDVFIVVLFAVIPFGIFVVFLIFALVSKTKYKKYFTVISALAGIEVILFIALAILFSVL